MRSGVLSAALAANAAGLSVVPAREDGSKRPEFDTWKEFQSCRASAGEVEDWFGSGRTGLGVVCGYVSNGLEMLELEGRAVTEGFNEQLHELAGAAGLGDALHSIEAGYLERTPSGGLHLLYRVPSPHGNTKLASRPATAAELAENPDVPVKVLIETRGEGGYCIVAPSYGRVHPDGGAWELVSGGFDTIVTITDAERDELWRLARLFDQMPELNRRQPKADAGGRPGDRYNNDPDAGQLVLEMLLRRGWTEVFRAGESTYLRRPGKSVGISATLGYVGPGVLRVFTTSTQFEARAYSPFGVYATLEHGGDFRAAARALASDGNTIGGHRKHSGSSSMGAGESQVDGVYELPPPSDPMQVANRLVADRFAAPGGGSRVRHWRGAFWDWRTSHWIEMEDRALQSIAYRYTETAVYTKETREGPELVPWAPTRHKVADLVDALRAVTHLAATVEMPAWLDDRERLPPDEFVSCANGLLHVPTRALIDHDPAYYNRVAVPFAYDPSPSSPDRWLAFLDELLA